ncbi:nuclear transport factor 2 family protein [Eubacteriaceae bacterium ES2]|nr:nuclear transport factor 2 family protein [Eubacteriaceae bacterium ES2]
MTILDKYVAGLNSGDADQVASLFAEDCKFDDGGARPFGFDDLAVEGRENLRAALQGVFGSAAVKATIIKQNPNSMEYDVNLGELSIPCIGAVSVKDGLIQEYIVRPR